MTLGQRFRAAMEKGGWTLLDLSIKTSIPVADLKLLGLDAHPEILTVDPYELAYGEPNGEVPALRSRPCLKLQSRKKGQWKKKLTHPPDLYIQIINLRENGGTYESIAKIVNRSAARVGQILIKAIARGWMS